MRVYTHLTLSEREFLELKLKEGKTLRWIAASLGRSPSTISREVKRNWSKKAKRYHHWNANNKVYFADAHAPWQRGSNENVNGLIRFFFPRGTDFTKVTDEQLDAVLELINNRPRKCLGYLSPIEFINKVLHLA